MPKTTFIKPFSWVAGTQWQSGRIELLFEDVRNGERRTGTFNNLMAKLHTRTPTSIRSNLKLSLCNLAPASTARYLETIGSPNLTATNQTVYACQIGGLQILFPAQLLILSLYGTSAPLRNVLLSPGGPELLMRPYLQDGEIKFRTDAQGKVEPTHRESERRRLEWVMTHPSARASWASVFYHASQGKLDLRLPHAALNAAVRGRLDGEVFAATNVHIWTLEPEEQAVKYARKPLGIHVLVRNKSGHDGQLSRPSPVQEPLLAGLRCVHKRFSNDEWAQVEVLLNAVRRRKKSLYPRRLMMQAIVNRLGRPCTWQEAASSSAKAEAARMYMSRLRKDGCWPQLLNLFSSFKVTGR